MRNVNTIENNNSLEEETC